MLPYFLVWLVICNWLLPSHGLFSGHFQGECALLWEVLCLLLPGFWDYYFRGIMSGIKSRTLLKSYLGLCLSDPSTPCILWVATASEKLRFSTFFFSCFAQWQVSLPFDLMWLGERWWVNSSSLFLWGCYRLGLHFNIGRASCKSLPLGQPKSLSFATLPLETEDLKYEEMAFTNVLRAKMALVLLGLPQNLTSMFPFKLNIYLTAFLKCC